MTASTICEIRSPPIPSPRRRYPGEQLHAPGRGVDTHVGDLVQPVLKLLIEVVEVGTSTRWQVRAVSVASAAAPPVAANPPPTLAPAPPVTIAPPEQPEPGPADAGQKPREETVFVAAVEDGRRQYEAASSDFAKGAARPARKQAICRILPARAVHGWVGKIEKLTTNGDGKGVISVEIAPNIHMKTMNNDLSDIIDETLVEPSSALYRSNCSPG